MYFGVDYHPEQWVYPYGGTADDPEAAWVQDIKLMTEAGINVVRIGEFTWGLCEPEEGKYDFDWLRRVMDLLGKAGIEVVLATPTAAPPIWLTKKHPEILPVDEGLHQAPSSMSAGPSPSVETVVPLPSSADLSVCQARLAHFTRRGNLDTPPKARSDPSSF